MDAKVMTGGNDNRMNKCLCGCGQDVSTSSTGRPGKFYNGTCRVRYHRQQKSVTEATEEISVVAPIEVVTNCNETIKPILKYPGAKWNMASWIVSFFPAHKHYIEPFAGSAAVFFSKPPEQHEVLNDLNEHIVNFFTVLRTRSEDLARAIMLTPFSEAEYNRIERNLSEGDELERARRFVTQSWQSHGGTIYQVSGWKHNGLKGNVYPSKLWKKIPGRLMVAAERLQNAEIRCKPALDIIRYYNTPDCLLYVDPPYHLDTRSRKYYSHEMTNQDHVELLEALREHKGIIVLSGYAHPLYEEMLTGGWERFEMPSLTEHGNIRNEVLWINRPVAHKQHRQHSFWDEEAM